MIPSWVEGQLRQVAALLTTNTPERTKTEFLRLGLRAVLHPIQEETARPFYRAVGRRRRASPAAGFAPESGCFCGPIGGAIETVKCPASPAPNLSVPSFS